MSMFELRTLVIGSVAFYFLLRLVPWLEQDVSNAGEHPRQAMALRLVNAFLAGATLHAALALYQYFVAPDQTITAEGVRRADVGRCCQKSASSHPCCGQGLL